MAKNEGTESPAPEKGQGGEVGTVVYEDYRDYANRNGWMFDFTLEVEKGYSAAIGCICQTCMEKASDRAEEFQKAVYALYQMGLEPLIHHGYSNDGYMFLHAVEMAYSIMQNGLKASLPDNQKLYPLVALILLCLQMTRYRDDIIYIECSNRNWPSPCDGKLKNKLTYGMFYMPEGFSYCGWVERAIEEMEHYVTVTVAEGTEEPYRKSIVELSRYAYLMAIPSSPTRH